MAATSPVSDVVSPPVSFDTQLQLVQPMHSFFMLHPAALGSNGIPIQTLQPAFDPNPPVEAMQKVEEMKCFATSGHSNGPLRNLVKRRSVATLRSMPNAPEPQLPVMAGFGNCAASNSTLQPPANPGGLYYTSGPGTIVLSAPDYLAAPQCDVNTSLSGNMGRPSARAKRPRAVSATVSSEEDDDADSSTDRDPRYKERRKRNNLAVKRSRDKANQKHKVHLISCNT